MADCWTLNDRLDLAKQLAMDGAGFDEIMRRTDVTPETARNYIARYGHGNESFDGLKRTMVENPEWLSNCKKVLTSPNDEEGSDVQ